MSTTTAVRPASDKQYAFLDRLLGERVLDRDLDAEFITSRVSSRVLDSREASQIIDLLLTQARKPAIHEDGSAISEGYFYVNGLIYKVQASKSSGNLYAKVFSEHGYEYAPGAMRLMPTATRLTLEQAAEAGVRTGRCVICAKELTDPESVARGIGPVCAARI